MSVVLIDAVRTPFGKAGSLYNGTRADDLVVRAIRGLLERNPQLNPADIDDVAIAAATQTGDQGMNIGRSASLLAGLPNTVPGYSVDRWCAGAMTSATTSARRATGRIRPATKRAAGTTTCRIHHYPFSREARRWPALRSTGPRRGSQQCAWPAQ